MADEEIMWDWLKAYKVSFYDIFWNIQGIEEYEKIYSISFEKELEKRKIGIDNLSEIKQILKEQIKKTSYHFGDPHLNVATLAGVYRMTIKEYDRRHNLKIDKKIIPYILRRSHSHFNREN